MIEAYVKSCVGQVRKNNEDNYCINGLINEMSVDESEQLLIAENNILLGVADGIGGGHAGEISSKVAVEVLKKQWEMLTNDGKQNPKTYSEIEKSIHEAYVEANEEIATLRYRFGPTGTTCTTFVSEGNRFWIKHIGDTRCYLLRDERLIRITEDQTLSGLKIKLGMYEEYTSEELEDRSKLMEFLGRDEYVASREYGWFKWEDNDIVLLCSDGLYDMCFDNQIKNILINGRNNKDIKEITNELINKANEAGGKDNITAALIGRS